MSAFYHNFSLFIEACCTPKSRLQEDSSTLPLLRKFPGGEQLVLTLHRESGLFHLQDYAAVRPNQIKWSDVKDTNQWVIFGGPEGTAAVRGTHSGYRIWLSNAEGNVRSVSSTHGGRTLDTIKSATGGINTVFVSQGGTGKVAQIRTQRGQIQRSAGRVLGEPMTVGQLAIRFRPLLAKLITAAEADMRGMVNNMIKSGAYRKAQNKMSYIDQLNDSLEALQDGEISSHVKNALSMAVKFSAAHYYPEQTGELRRVYGGYEAGSRHGENKLLADIGAGDNKKLASVLGFFQRFLVHKS